MGKTSTSLGHATFYVATCTLLIASPQGAEAQFWKSCDERWIAAWEKCEHRDYILPLHGRVGGACEIPSDRKPSCEPNDAYLKNYRGGEPEFRAKEAAREQRYQENLARTQARISAARQGIGIGGFQYQSGWSIGGQSVSVSAEVVNLDRAQTIRSVRLNCSVIANGAVELYSGPAWVQLSIIPGGRARADLIFKDVQAEQRASSDRRSTRSIFDPDLVGVISGYTAYKEPGDHSKHYLSTRGQDIRALAVSCDVVDGNLN